MSHGKRGMEIIFNNDNFHMDHVKPRMGDKFDFENLINVLKDLGFEVNDFKNSTKIGIAKQLEKGIIFLFNFYTTNLY